MGTSPVRILLLDDDAELAQLLTEYLGEDGFDVATTGAVERALDQVLAGWPQLLLLDVMLAQASGFDVLRRLRTHSDLPVVMLTARGDDVDRILGLELGADDYVAKPFHPRELTARIRAVLRRGRASEPLAARPPPLALGDIRLDFGTRRVSRDAKPVAVTGVEFTLLEVLLRSAGQLVTREDLFRRVLGRRMEPFDRSIDMHVSNLRRKLGRTVDGVERIQSVRGVGYLYAAPDAPSAAEPH